MEKIYLAIAFTPLIGAIIAGFFGAKIGRAGAHWVTSAGVGISAFLSIIVLLGFITGHREAFNGSVYTWMISDGITFEVGFLVDTLTAMMMAVSVSTKKPTSKVIKEVKRVPTVTSAFLATSHCLPFQCCYWLCPITFCSCFSDGRLWDLSLTS